MTPSKPSITTTTPATATTTTAASTDRVFNTTNRTTNSAEAADEAMRVWNRVLEPLIETLKDKDSTWHGTSLLSVAKITASGLSRLFRVTDSMRELARNGGGGETATAVLVCQPTLGYGPLASQSASRDGVPSKQRPALACAGGCVDGILQPFLSSVTGGVVEVSQRANPTNDHNNDDIGAKIACLVGTGRSIIIIIIIIMAKEGWDGHGLEQYQ